MSSQENSSPEIKLTITNEEENMSEKDIAKDKDYDSEFDTDYESEIETDGEGEGDDEENDIDEAGVEEKKEDEDVDEDDEEDDMSDSDYESDNELEYFNDDLRKEYIKKYHPELNKINSNELNALTKVVRDEDGNIIDELHKTIPIITKFERTKVIGLRTKQLSNGSKPFIDVPEHMIDMYQIAVMEFESKKIPFIICRPLPSGRKEYWKISDLEIL